MTASPEAFELTRSDFENLVGREFGFLCDEFGFPEPLFWEFAGMLHMSFEDDRARIVTWCGKRDDSVWTWVERLAIGRMLALDTVNSVLESEFDYPPDTGFYWTHDEAEERVALEAAILRTHLPALLGDDVAIYEAYGGNITPDSVALDDPVETFPRRCAERFHFLDAEYGLKYELDGMGGTVLYRGDPVSVRISLLETSYEHEVEPQPTVLAEIANAPEAKPSPLFIDAVELDIAEREGSFSPAYLDRAFDEVERELRARLPLSGAAGG